MPVDRATPAVRKFGTYTPDVQALADWRGGCGIKTVALESTGVYWLPIYEMLEARGLTVCVVNPSHLKHVPGRKSDVQDCQWLQRLHTYGLLSASFRPAADICAIRSYVRQRARLIDYRAAHLQHMQKALPQMNLPLPQGLSDLTGKTGLAPAGHHRQAQHPQQACARLWCAHPAV